MVDALGGSYGRDMAFAVVVFTLFGCMGVFASVSWTLTPEMQWKMMTPSAGVSLNEIAERAESGRGLRFIAGVGASQMLGLNAFTVALVWIPFRAGEAWAWAALWFFPLMFVWHFITYEKGTRMSRVQVMNFSLAVGALIASAHRFF